jgi:hypothetical protein
MSDSIDATVVLGLAGKVSKVFAEPDTFLSFPLSSIGMERVRFRALAADPLSSDGTQGLGEFSLLVNEIPDGPLWQPTGSQRLWDIYGDVLDAHLAQTTRTPAEEAAYQHAYGVLYQVESNGSVVDTPAVVAYQQYRDAYLAALQEYNNRHGQAELSTDKAVKDKWAADEPLLHAHLDDAERAWEIKGHRSEVEGARSVLREVGSKSPATVWAGYKKVFDPDLPEAFFRSSVPDGWMYVPTAYMPSDAVDVPWLSITVARDELPALAAAAPPDLRSRLGNSSDAGIELVSFEYSSVTVHRGWFAPEAFGSDAWQFYEQGRVLSDGGRPPKGQCPAYVSGLVLARNISVRHRTNGVAPPNLVFLPTTRALTKVPIASPQMATAIGARVTARRELQLKVGATPPPAEVRKTVPAPVIRATPTAVRQPIYANFQAAGAIRMAAPVASAPKVTSAALHTMVNPSVIHMTVGGAPTPTPTPNPATTTTTTDPNHLYILAFICRWVPKSPNPNPALKW